MAGARDKRTRMPRAACLRAASAHRQDGGGLLMRYDGGLCASRRGARHRLLTHLRLRFIVTVRHSDLCITWRGRADVENVASRALTFAPLASHIASLACIRALFRTLRLDGGN